MNPILLGVIIGMALALLYFLASAFFSSRVISHSKMTSVALVLDRICCPTDIDRYHFLRPHKS